MNKSIQWIISIILGIIIFVVSILYGPNSQYAKDNFREKINKELILNNIGKVSYLNYVNSNRISKGYLDMTVVTTGGKMIDIHIPDFNLMDDYNYTEIIKNEIKRIDLKNNREKNLKTNPYYGYQTNIECIYKKGGICYGYMLYYGIFIKDILKLKHFILGDSIFVASMNDYSNPSEHLPAQLAHLTKFEKIDFNKVKKSFFEYIQNKGVNKIVINMSEYGINNYYSNEDLEDFKNSLNHKFDILILKTLKEKYPYSKEKYYNYITNSNDTYLIFKLK